MSQENVELTRQAYEAWNDGDLDWMLRSESLDVVLHAVQHAV
jgi:hypothetical protein